MMAVLLQKELGDEFQVESAGTFKKWGEWPGEPANGHAILCLEEMGIDISDHRSRWIGDLDLSSFSHIVCVNEKALDNTVLFLAGYRGAKIIVANGNYGGIPDPYGKGLGAYRECLSLMEKVVPDIANQIRASR